MPAVVLGLVATWTGPGIAQAQQTGGGVIVAVLDLAKVFEQNSRLQADIKTIKDEYKAFQQQVINDRKSLGQKVKQLEQLKTTSPEYRRLEADLAQQDSAMQVRVRLKQKEFQQREAQAHYRAYKEVLGAIEAVCKRHAISLVLRYDSKEIDPANGNSIMRGITRSVVYQSRLDITDLVVKELFATAQRPVAPRR